MWAIGYIAVPMLFSLLDDRMLAGMLAGRMFTAISYLGLVCGTLLVISTLLFNTGKNCIRSWRWWLLLGMLILVGLGQFLLQPMMAELRGLELIGEIAERFNRLHGISATLFLFTSLAGLILVIFGLYPSQLKPPRMV